MKAVIIQDSNGKTIICVSNEAADTPEQAAEKYMELRKMLEKENK